MGSLIDEYCDDCVYLSILRDHDYFCDFLTFEKQPRGCPAGEGCTRKKTIDKPKWSPSQERFFYRKIHVKRRMEKKDAEEQLHTD